MSMSDPIADMLTRIRNAHLVNKKNVSIPANNLKISIAVVLKDAGYINSFEVEGEKALKALNINLKYFENKPVIENIKRISKPSLRVYTDKENIPKIMNGLGVVILSTPKGVMTGHDAKLQNVGGEVLFSVF